MRTHGGPKEGEKKTLADFSGILTHNDQIALRLSFLAQLCSDKTGHMS